MPTKLIVLLALMAVSVGTNLFTGRFLAAIIGGLLIAGVFSGSDSVRKLLIVLAWIGIAFGVVGLVMLVLAGASGLGGALAFFGLIGIAYAVACNGFFVWCLAQDDVRDWMFRKSMNLQDVDDGRQKLPPP